MDVQRLHVLWQSVRNTINVVGNVCEIGVYRGGSSYFLALAYKELGGNPELHAIDTFKGHADGTIRSVDTYHTVGMFSDTSYESVCDYLGKFANVSVHKGEFSSVAPKLGGSRFRLVHIDTDLYQPTLDCLEFFAPKMSQGGLFIIDDYFGNKCPGVTRAVHEFCEFHPEYIFWYFHTEQIVLVRSST
jgi:O-methyltransferase